VFDSRNKRKKNPLQRPASLEMMPLAWADYVRNPTDGGFYIRTEEVNDPRCRRSGETK